MASIAGRVNEQLESLARVRFLTGGEVECIVDTGATCALVLPPSLVAELDLPIVGDDEELWMVGDERTSAALALAQIEWLGQVRFAEVIVKDDFIIGTELLKDARLVVDYPARTLTISLEERPNSR